MRRADYKCPIENLKLPVTGTVPNEDLRLRGPPRVASEQQRALAVSDLWPRSIECCMI